MRGMCVGQTVAAAGDCFCPPCEGFAIEGGVNNPPVQGTLVHGLSVVRHVVSGPRGALEYLTGLGNCPEVGEKLGGLVMVCRGKDCRQHGMAFGPEIYICDQALAGSLRVATGTLSRLHVPCFREKLSDVNILSGHYPLDKLRGN